MRALCLTFDCRVQGYNVVMSICIHSLAKKDCQECMKRKMAQHTGSKRLRVPEVVAPAESAKQGETCRALSTQFRVKPHLTKATVPVRVTHVTHGVFIVLPVVVLWYAF